jgi:hypothetical protein
VVAIDLSAQGVARVRVATSALWEVVTSLRVLRDPARYPVHAPWSRRVGPAVAGAGLLGGLLRHLDPGPPGYLPDFLTPTPARPDADLDAELETLLATPEATVRAQLDLLAGRAHPEVRALYADPAAGLRHLAGQVRGYWRIALAPYWPRIALLLDAERHARARQLAGHGVGHLLNDLHERIRWDGASLSVDQRACTAADLPDGPGLVLVASVFVWPSVMSVNLRHAPQLAYPARGVARLWETTGQPTADGLAAVVGRGRAAILVAMDVPVSTSQLARRTGITAGGVSRHLAALRAAGLVATHRHGRELLNTRTVAADALLSAAG